ncbi:hypothetical protein IT397_01660 [Candidatus Nomurabacteria bacterium]|nr:hypothetical protein [Candidatus Nomurabacteria bacterium]
MKTLYILIFLNIISLSFFSCESLIEPLKTEEPMPYMQLNVGDIRQYYDDPEGFYIQWEIVDTTRRIDGQKVFVSEESILTQSAIFFSKNYYFINSEYFIQTELDSLNYPKNYENNPFYERKLAKIFPKKSDVFLINDGSTDFDKAFFKIKFIDSLYAYCKTFREVAEYEKIDNDTVRSISTYYTKYFGHIGAVLGNQNGIATIYAIYIKVGDKEVGEFFPFPTRQIIKDSSQIKFLTIPSLFR